jgi:hypothetical protein
MDQLDTHLERAWAALSARCRSDRREAARRFRRTRGCLLRRPPRAWCLCLRASDTRISPFNAIIDITADPRYPHPLALEVHDADHALRLGTPHAITLDGETIRDLTRPVSIAWPGVEWTIAAAMLGRHPCSIARWIKRGVLRVFERRPAHALGRGGRPIPIVWSPSPLDPNAFEAAAPDPVWGTLWRHLSDRMPLNYALTVTRVPRDRPVTVRSREGGRWIDIRRRGWEFICPGRLNLDGSLRACGRRCTRLYAPQTIWTLPMALGPDEAFDLAPDSEPDCDPDSDPDSRQDTGQSSDVEICTKLDKRSSARSRAARSPAPAHAPAHFPAHVPGGPLRLAGQWRPAMTDPSRATGPRSFACRRCWNVRFVNLRDRSCWHEFITYISGGLLMGHEVTPPGQQDGQQDEEIETAVRFVRRRAIHKPRVFRRAITARRAGVLAGLLAGQPYAAIARQLGISAQAVNYHAQQIYREHGLSPRTCGGKCREQLIARLGQSAEGSEPLDRAATR